MAEQESEYQQLRESEPEFDTFCEELRDEMHRLDIPSGFPDQEPFEELAMWLWGKMTEARHEKA